MQTSFQLFLHRTIERKVDNCLLPFLDHAWTEGVHVDLQDAFQRLTFDNICSLVFGYDPNCLSIELPEVACEKAFSQAEDTLFYRHVKPSFLWKLQEWLQIGNEKKFKETQKILNHWVYAEIKSKRRNSTNIESQFDLLSVLIREEGQNDDQFLRDTAINLLAAGRDTISAGLTWFFWLVATHPLVEAKIVEEIRENLPSRDVVNWKDLGVEGLNKLVYLHGAISEALRLYPPVPNEHKCALNSDVLPSGHKIKPNTIIVYSLYSVGRVEETWGEDCLEFKPERWISKRGGIVHVPSYKFIAFNAGPRSCLGKDMSFTEMKMVAAAMIWNYHIHVVDGHPISPSISVILHMKHGLKVRVTKRGV